MRGRKRINTRKEVPRREMGGPLSAALFFFKRLKKYIWPHQVLMVAHGM